MVPLEDIKIPAVEISVEECDRCLGHFMRTWDQIEMALFNMFRKLIDTDMVTANTIFRSGINLRTLREITQQLGKNRLQPADQAKLKALLGRFQKASTKRNRIVHGSWTIHLEMSPKPRPKPLTAKSAKWIRQSLPSDREEFEKLMRGKSKKLEAAYLFTPKQLVATASHVQKIAGDMNDFTNSVALLPASDPRPVDW